MSKRISKEAQQKILEAHGLKLSQSEAAKYAGVSQTNVHNYWKAAGLKPPFPYRALYLPKETQDLIYAAWELKLSARKASKYLGIGRKSVLTYWKAAGLNPHRKAGLAKETQDLIYAAWERGLSACKTSTYLGISIPSVLRYWNAAGLKSHHAQWRDGSLGLKVSLEILLDGVFDTVKNPNEALGLDQIIERLKDRLDIKKVNTKDLQEKINQLVGWGCYNVVQKDGKVYYSAGMPAAMDGNLKASVASK